jgi:hypothetical protein
MRFGSVPSREAPRLTRRRRRVKAAPRTRLALTGITTIAVQKINLGYVIGFGILGHAREKANQAGRVDD